MKTATDFFRKNVIMTDLENRNAAIPQYVEGATSTIIDEEVDGKQHFGYKIEKDNKAFDVVMEYVADEFGQYAILENKWTIIYNEQVHEGLPSLREVFEFINSK